MVCKLGINGFGRIGRLVCRSALARDGVVSGNHNLNYAMSRPHLLHASLKNKSASTSFCVEPRLEHQDPIISVDCYSIGILVHRRSCDSLDPCVIR